jgi:TolB-like protein/Flp pilus assembly protein TadD
LVRGALLDAQGAELRLRPKAFALLHHLVGNAGRLIGRDDILAAVWPGVFVTEDSISLCVRQVRAALGDPDGRLLRTVPRRGYLLAAEVSRLDAAPPPTPAPTASTAEPAPRGAVETRWAGRPMLVVLPFANMTADPEQEYFADGITEDLTTALSHLRWFVVIARNSAFTYKGRAVDVRQIGSELGVGYALEGSVRKAGGRLRITAQLCEVETGGHVWAERFDGDLADVFDLQDRVTEAVVGAIEPSLRLAEVERARSRPTKSLSAYDLYLRALPQGYASREGSDEAQRLLRQAIALDPDYIVATGTLARMHTFRFAQGWSKEGDVEEGVRCARQVEQSGRNDPGALSAAAHALAYLARDYEAGFAAAHRAFLLAPNSAVVLLSYGWMRAYLGEADAALELIGRAKRLSPVDPVAFIFSAALSYAHFVVGRYDLAAHTALQAVRDRPSYLVAHRLLAASLGQLGRVEEAAEAARALLALTPGYTIADAVGHASMRDPAMRDRFLNGLRRAGLPE